MGQQFFTFAPVVGILALIFAFTKSRWISGQEVGTDKMREISTYIREGAMAFLSRRPWRQTWSCRARSDSLRHRVASTYLMPPLDRARSKLQQAPRSLAVPGA